MGKDKKKNKKEEKISLQPTAKFTVLDAPGISQPKQEEDTPTTKEGKQGRRAKAGSGPHIESSTKIGGDSYSKQKNPEWLKERLDVYERVKSRRMEELAGKTQVCIRVTLPDGKVLDKDKGGEEFMAWKTTPYDVAVVISQGLADSTVVARVTYQDFVEDYDLEEVRYMYSYVSSRLIYF